MMYVITTVLLVAGLALRWGWKKMRKEVDHATN